MKKYLLTGMAAIAFCAAFNSCSKSGDLYDEDLIEKNGVEKIKADYEAAFIATFGQPAPNQDWGFGSSSTRAIYDADHPGAYPNANQWADDGWKAPTELTAGQRLRVRAYFQANPNLTYVDPEYTDFFVQQVYKGGVAPGAISSEVYYTTNGDPQTGSDNMDHLTFGIENGEAKDHVYNYNQGRYSTKNTSDPEDLGAPRENVQNYPNVEYHNDNGDGTHRDQIMLMTGSSTECVGFMSSVPSQEHNDCMANASAEAIDKWANDNREALQAAGLFGEAVTDPLWKRSFVGLDYEAMPLEDAYTTPKKVAKALDFANGGYAYILYNKTIYKVGELADFDLKDNYNNPVYYVKDNVSNMAVGKRMKYTKDGQETDITRNYCNYNMSKTELEDTYHVTGVEHNQEQVYDLDKIIELAKANCLPTETNAYWVKDLGGRDYVFSDWIITLTKASQDKKADIMIIAEDLSVGDGHEDFDFNDVVIQVYYGDKGEAKAKILAAGGTLPLTVDGKDVHQEFSKANKDIDCAGKMINTNGTKSADANIRSRSLDGLIAPVIELEEEVKTPAQARDNIAIKVYKNNQWIELDAVISKCASKVRVGLDYKWKDEREYVGDNFKDFVSDKVGYTDWYKQP